MQKDNKNPLEDIHVKRVYEKLTGAVMKSVDEWHNPTKEGYISYMGSLNEVTKANLSGAEIEELYDILEFNSKKSGIDMHTAIDQAFANMLPIPNIERIKIDFAYDDSYAEIIYKLLEEDK